MERIFLKATDDTPLIILDTNTREYKIEGRSLPENAVAFYLPIIDWLEAFGKSNYNDLLLNIKLDYFNTASAKQITKLLLVLHGISKQKNIKIMWHYFADDMDIKASGLRFAKLINIDIELVPYEE